MGMNSNMKRKIKKSFIGHIKKNAICKWVRIPDNDFGYYNNKYLEVNSSIMKYKEDKHIIKVKITIEEM